MGWPSGWLGRVGEFELRIIPVNQPNCTLPAFRLRVKKDAGSARAIWRLPGDAYVIGRRGGIARPIKNGTERKVCSTRSIPPPGYSSNCRPGIAITALCRAHRPALL